MDRASDYGSEGWRFESFRARHQIKDLADLNRHQDSHGTSGNQGNKLPLDATRRAGIAVTFAGLAGCAYSRDTSLAEPMKDPVVVVDTVVKGVSDAVVWGLALR